MSGSAHLKEYSDRRVEEACAIMSTKVTYKTDQISLPCDSAISSSLKFCFLCILL